MRTLMQLLNVGQSIVDLRCERQKYEIAKQGWLPKFEPSPDFQVSRSSVHSTSSASSERPTFQRSNHRTIEELNNRKLTSKATGNATVLQQGELNLDKIKVVCNDLADSDIELKFHGSSRVSPQKDQGNWSKVRYKAGLNWLAERFFRTSKTHI